MMKRFDILVTLLGITLMTVLLTGCGQAEPPAPSDMPNATSEPPTATPVPTATPEPTSTPFPIEELTINSPASLLPGVEVIPIEEFFEGVPWLYKEIGPALPAYILFNQRSAVFDDPLVRQALSYAVDRQAIAAIVSELDSQSYTITHRPATVMTPPEVLGRDLYGAVGINFDPQKAQELFAEAGYQNPADFPEITFLVPSGYPNSESIVNPVIDMWRESLGISVKKIMNDGLQDLLTLLGTDSYDVAFLIWETDYRDPHNFLMDTFHTGESWNLALYSNPEFDSLVEQAKELKAPSERLVLYIQAEHILCNLDPGLIPLFFRGNPFPAK